VTAPAFEDGVIRVRPPVDGDVAPYVASARLDRAWLDPPELRGYEWTVAGAGDNAFLGSLVLHSCAWAHRRVEVGFWVAPPARGRGTVTAALRLLVAWLVDDAGVERVEMTALPGNDAVGRIAAKLGFAFEGTLRQRNLEQGRRADVLMWGLLADEWRSARR
jgi:ribosomal-protein-serine acetyltransferase